MHTSRTRTYYSPSTHRRHPYYSPSTHRRHPYYSPSTHRAPIRQPQVHPSPAPVPVLGVWAVERT
eukprot:6340540-Pyramimonas_sp.AAC.2